MNFRPVGGYAGLHDARPARPPTGLDGTPSSVVQLDDELNYAGRTGLTWGCAHELGVTDVIAPRRATSDHTILRGVDW